MENDGNGLSFNSAFEYVNNITLFVMLAAIIVLPPWIIYFYCKNFAKLQDEEFEKKYGATFEGLRTESKAVLAYPIIFILRRFALVLIITVGKNYLFEQICIMFVFSST